jgi:hypothetical protein
MKYITLIFVSLFLISQDTHTYNNQHNSKPIKVTIYPADQVRSLLLDKKKHQRNVQQAAVTCTASLIVMSILAYLKSLEKNPLLQLSAITAISSGIYGCWNLRSERCTRLEIEELAEKYNIEIQECYDIQHLEKVSQETQTS